MPFKKGRLTIYAFQKRKTHYLCLSKREDSLFMPFKIGRLTIYIFMPFKIGRLTIYAFQKRETHYLCLSKKGDSLFMPFKKGRLTIYAFQNRETEFMPFKIGKLTIYEWESTGMLKSPYTKWATVQQNQKDDLCAQQRLRSAWASTQSDQSSLSACRISGFLATHEVHSKDWSDWADVQANLSLRWVHWSFCWFCCAVAQIWTLEL